MEEVLVEDRGPVRWIIMNRPEVMNAITGRMLGELNEAFKAADDVRAVIRDMPADRIIVETDCPYLAPVPHRGRRNEPAFLPAVLAGLAAVRGWTPEDAEARCEDAFFALFDRIPRP